MLGGLLALTDTEFHAARNGSAAEDFVSKSKLQLYFIIYLFIIFEI